MENINYSDFFKNLTDIPLVGTQERKDLRKQEKERCMGGVYVNGIYFSGWLYWHLNHWWIRDDYEDEYGNIVRNKFRPSLRDNEWIVGEYLEICRKEKKGYMHIGVRQFGKDLLNSSLLYQEDKEITIGNCNVGDKIYGSDGKLTTITGKYPQGIKPVYKITLVDGREINCGLEHNWYVYDRLLKKNVIKTTNELLKNYKKTRFDWVNTRKNPYEFRYSIPNNNAVEYHKKQLNIDPYILGLWLGDGSNTYSKITNVDQPIIDDIYKFAKTIGVQVTVDDIDTFMVTSGKRGKGLNDRNPFHSFLKNKNLYNNKHIPKEYFYSSVEQRMELLRGLMDSDGSCGKNGVIEFSSSIPKLAEDFYKLCRSLGINLSKKIKKTFYKKDNTIRIACKDSNRFTLYTNKPVFRLKRKLDNIRRNPKYLEHTTIVGIDYTHSDETTCITVDNEDHLFLTDNYTTTHNSEIMASYLAYNATMFKYTQNVIVGGNDDDLNTIRDKIDFGIDHVWDGIRKPKLDKDIRKNQIRLGYKTKDNDAETWSYLIVRNVAQGKNTEGPAGVTAKAYATDEIGKFPFSQSFESAKPAFVSKFGWRCVPLLFGTGGSFEKGADAERFFYHPEANNMLAVVDPETGDKTAIFMSGLYKIDCKYRTTLATFLLESKRISIDTDVTELSKIEMDVSDKEKARESILKERRLKANDPDQTEYLKQVMYYPLTPKECFLSSSENFYNTSIAKQQKEKLEVQFPGLNIGMCVDLFDEGEKITHKPSSSTPISSYPCKPTEDKNTPIVILEHPIPNPPWGLYVFGVDPYRFEKADNSDSLGACYIFKRMYDVQGDSFQDMPVAWYVGRPDSKESWNNNVRLLIKYYNATGLCENDEMSFIDYMLSKGDGHYLMDTPDWLKEFIPTSSTVQRAKGISSANQKVSELLRTNLKQYMEEVFQTIPVPGSEETKKLLGVSRIYDPMLLEEVIKWNKDGNFDRLIAMSLAITCARKMDAQRYQIDVQEVDPRFKTPERKQQRGVFKEIGTSYKYQTPKSRLQRLLK